MCIKDKGRHLHSSVSVWSLRKVWYSVSIKDRMACLCDFIFVATPLIENDPGKTKICFIFNLDQFLQPKFAGQSHIRAPG